MPARETLRDQRPDPDLLLEQARAAEAGRGRLELFFGAAPGVGKTYAMLEAARARRAEGLDVVVGVVETHGRAETAALLEGLERLPSREVAYRGRTLRELDLDAALARRPALILVDELAHHNAPGSRHPKRWQDVEELLDAGIDVYSTLNVQHLESLNDVVQAITGVEVREKVPDRLLEQADEVALIDLPVDDLLERLRAGKVYLPDQAGRALGSFFREGNLLALRELALRRTADRVDQQMRRYRTEQVGGEVWPAQEAMLVCLGPRPGADKLVRTAARLARSQNVRWHAVYVEAPRLGRLSKEERAEILRHLRLAEELGAETATLSSQDVVTALVDYARRHNLRRLVLGRSKSSRFGPITWRFSLSAHVARAAPDLDLLLISHEDQPAGAKPLGTREEEAQAWQPARYAWSLGTSVATLLLTYPLAKVVDLTNIVMLFLLSVVLVAVRLGRGPAVLAAVVNVFLFDFFFVPPHLSFTVHDLQYVITFGVMTIIGLVTAHLTAGLRYQARVASYREERAQHLFALARALAAATSAAQVAAVVRESVERALRGKAAVLLAALEPAEADSAEPSRARLEPPADPPPGLDLAVASWCFDHASPAGRGTDTLPAARHLYLPLVAPEQVRGVLAIEPPNPRRLMIPEQRRLLETMAALASIALERIHFVALAQASVVTVESERLRNSLLAALSHDLRTPLTALVGLADNAALELERGAALEPGRLVKVADQARRLARLVESLLEMARLQAGGLDLRKDWQSVEEMVGGALRALEGPLAGQPLELDIPADLPLVACDAVLIERVLVNLLENALKYAPGAPLGIRARAGARALAIEVWDGGPGLPAGRERAIFEKFTRGLPETAIPGVGLGLAICRAIVEAHGGRIEADALEPSGASFRFTLPLEPAPEAEEDPPSATPP